MFDSLFGMEMGSSNRAVMRMEVKNELLRISGIMELSSSNAGLFQEQVLARFGGETKDIEIDLSETVLVDCSGLGALLALDRVCRDRNGSLRLLDPSPTVEQILELTRMENVMEIVTGCR